MSAAIFFGNFDFTSHAESHPLETMELLTCSNLMIWPWLVTQLVSEFKMTQQKIETSHFAHWKVHRCDRCGCVWECWEFPPLSWYPTDSEKRLKSRLFGDQNGPKKLETLTKMAQPPKAVASQNGKPHFNHHPALSGIRSKLRNLWTVPAGSSEKFACCM